jgi:hypothetical protein
LYQFEAFSHAWLFSLAKVLGVCSPLYRFGKAFAEEECCEDTRGARQQEDYTILVYNRFGSLDDLAHYSTGDRST